MVSRSFVRAVLVGAGIALIVVLAVVMLGGREEQPKPPADFNPADFVVRGGPRLDAPYVATDYEVVDAMLALARVRPDDYVIDLGSGDGRILIAAARSHGARGLGVDIDPARIRESNENARAVGVTDRVEFRRQDLFETPLQQADVLTLYLSAEVNERLRPRILSQMRPGTRVVSHDFDMGEWRPERRERVGTATIYMWIVPARVEGRWTVSIDGETGTLELDQRFQELSGTLTLGGRSTPVEHGRLIGRRIHFVADLGEGPRTFEGRIVDDRIEPRRGGGEWRAVRAS